MNYSEGNERKREIMGKKRTFNALIIIACDKLKLAILCTSFMLNNTNNNNSRVLKISITFAKRECSSMVNCPAGTLLNYF